MNGDLDAMIKFPNRRADEPDATGMQHRILENLGVEPEKLEGIGTDQAAKLIRAVVYAVAAVQTLRASDHVDRAILDPDEIVEPFQMRVDLPDRRPDEPAATPTQTRILGELDVQQDVCGNLGVDQASVLIRDVATALAEKQSIEAIQRAKAWELM